jgi:hypothetical protein
MDQYRLIRDERGMETVEWLAFGGVLITIIAVVYEVLSGNAALRGAIKAATTFYAVNFGKDIGANAPRLTCLEDREDRQRVPCPTLPFDPAPFAPPDFALAEFAAHAQTPAVFDPSTQTLAIFDPARRAQLVIRPAEHVTAAVEPGTWKLRLFDSAQQRAAIFDPIRREAILVDPVTNVPTPASLVALQQLGLVEVSFATEPARGPSIALLALGVPGWFTSGEGGR